MKSLCSVLLVLAISSTMFAQDVSTPTQRSEPSSYADLSEADHPQERPPVRHITDLLLESPEGRQALEAFRRAKARADVPSAKTAQTYTVGDTADFNVFNVDENRWMEDIAFILKRKGPALYLWVEKAELDSNYVRDRDTDSLYSALQESTPPSSYDPDEGIIVNNNKVFGDPSDIDDNDRVHVLLTDIKDGREENNGEWYVAGFFHPTDLNPNSSSGNQGEVLYLDTRPGIYTDEEEYQLSGNLQSTAAHEYQHLIHANYDTREETFVNEGLSEWAEILNGYPRRPADYLSDPSDSTGYNVYLFNWRTNEDHVLFDYQRAGLLTHYLVEQIGVMETGALTRSSRRGVSGYNEVLDDRSFQEFLLDFHTANRLNDVAHNPRYGYVDRGRRGLRAQSTFTYDSRTDDRTPSTNTSVSAGAVQYLEWNHVENLRVNLDASTASDDVRQRFLIRAIGERPDGSITVETFTPRVNRTFSGMYRRLTLIAAHVKPHQRDAQITFSAEWEESTQSYTRVETAYDDGTPYIDEESDRVVVFTTGAGSDGVSATRFPVPDSETAILSKVSLAFYYLSQFNDGPPQDAPRDFTLYVWDNSSTDRTPGQEIFSVTLDDPRSYRRGINPSSLDRFTVDLAEYQEQLTNLPDTIFVGVGEAGDDENHIVLAPADYERTNTSFVGNKTTESIAWASLWETELQNGISLDQTTLPTRAEFLVADTTSNGTTGPGAAPDSLVLAANYPNPFNNETQIEFGIPKEGHVRLRVFDALGRHITTLVDEVRSEGRYPVPVEANGWASGIYFYVLEYEGQRLHQKMMLVK